MYQQFAKTNTFSLSFHILFSPFLHIFSQDASKSGFGDGQKWGWTPPQSGGSGLNSTPSYYSVQFHVYRLLIAPSIMDNLIIII